LLLVIQSNETAGKSSIATLRNVLFTLPKAIFGKQPLFIASTTPFMKKIFILALILPLGLLACKTQSSKEKMDTKGDTIALSPLRKQL
jgi:hypothetical protein